MKSKTRNFDIQSKLGSGSFGVIFKAINRNTRQVCVLKQITLSRLSERARKSAINEATIMGKLSHPYIVRYQESFIEDNILNIVMEYCDNADLSVFLKMQNKKPLKEEKIWRFFLQITAGLEYIHRNRILHRDIKTLNIFLNKAEEVKIGDLGVAKMLSSNEFAQTMVGTPFYLSPELCEEKPYNEKSDIWALGCLLYQLCTFQHPFEAQNQASLILKIIRGKYAPIPEFYSKDLKDVIDMCLERDYKRRPTAVNILARPKIKELVEQFKINKAVEEYSKQLSSVKEILEKPVQVVQPKQPEVKKPEERRGPTKSVDQIPKKEVKKEEWQKEVKKEEPQKDVKKEEPQKEVKKEESQKEVKKEDLQTPAKVVNLNRNNTPKTNEREPKAEETPIGKKQSKNDFISNLQKMMKEEEKMKEGKDKKLIVKNALPPHPPPIAYEISWKSKDAPLAQKVGQKNEERMLQNHYLKPRMSVQNLKPENPRYLESAKKNISADQIPHFPPKPKSTSGAKGQQQKGPPQMVPPQMVPPQMGPPQMGPTSTPSPPLFPPMDQGKEQVIRVKMDKPVPSKVYEGQKKPVGIIKSGGFTPNEGEEKIIEHSRDRVASKQRNTSKRNLVGVEKEESKQLFGLVEKSILVPKESILVPKVEPRQTYKQAYKQSPKQGCKQAHKQGEVKASEVRVGGRIRKGSKQELSRQARNPVRYVTKQEEALVMNLPNGHDSSSDSQEKPRKSSRADEAKARTSKQFHLKEINDQLIMQKYQDLLKSEEEATNPTCDSQPETHSILEPSEQPQRDPRFVKCLDNEDYVQEEIQAPNSRKNSTEPIYEELQADAKQHQSIEGEGEGEGEEEGEGEGDAQEQIQFEGDAQGKGQIQVEGSEWQFDEEPQLAQMQEQREFEQNNPYLVEEEEKLQDRKNYLQIKLGQNMKRQDEINQLMQIKIEECRVFVPNGSVFEQILGFFRKKINMESEYTEEDEREVEVFLRRKGLTDQRKFQNIYKIMHFEMELENTSKIIQRICHKLTELEALEG